MPPVDAPPFYADDLALLAALDGRLEAAALRARYADAAFDRLHAEGTALRDAAIEALAFGDGSAR